MLLKSEQNLCSWRKALTDDPLAALRGRQNDLARRANVTSHHRCELATLQDELEQLTCFHPDGSFNTDVYRAAKQEEAFWSQFEHETLSPNDILMLLEHTAQLLTNLKKL